MDVNNKLMFNGKHGLLVKQKSRTGSLDDWF